MTAGDIAVRARTAIRTSSFTESVIREMTHVANQPYAILAGAKPVFVRLKGLEGNDEDPAWRALQLVHKPDSIATDDHRYRHSQL